MGNNFHTKRLHNQLKLKFNTQYKEWITSQLKKNILKKEIKKLSKISELKMLDLKGTMLSFLEKEINNLFLFIQSKKVALAKQYPGGLDSLQQMRKKDIAQLLQTESLNNELYQIRKQIQFKYRQQNFSLKEKLKKIQTDIFQECQQQQKKFQQIKVIQQKISLSKLNYLKQEAQQFYQKQISEQLSKISAKINQQFSWRSQQKKISHFNCQIEKKIDAIVRKALVQIDVNAKKLVGGYFDQDLIQ